MSARRSATDEGSALLSMRAREYRAGISRLNANKGRLGVAYGHWTPGRPATATRPAVRARQEVYGVYDVDRTDTGERFYVEREGYQEPGGISYGLALGGPGWRPEIRHWVHIDMLAAVQMFGEEEQ